MGLNDAQSAGRKAGARRRWLDVRQRALCERQSRQSEIRPTKAVLAVGGTSDHRVLCVSRWRRLRSSAAESVAGAYPMGNRASVEDAKKFLSRCGSGAQCIVCGKG